MEDSIGHAVLSYLCLTLPKIRLFPICLKPLFQSKVNCEVIKNLSIFSYANKTFFHHKVFAYIASF